MSTSPHVPPGFRFHPTDEELVDYYLRKKVNSKRIDLDIIKDVDLYKIEPWDLQELCKIGNGEQSDWYFFSHKDKKYPTGTRTNRATRAGFWKATGRDKAIYSKTFLVGMRKTLVFYKGRAPNGQKSDWIMHEYRLETNENGTSQEEGWVVCRAFKKRITTTRREGDHSLNWYNDDNFQASFIQEFDSPTQISHPYHHNSFKQELQLHHNLPPPQPSFLQLPQLAETPKFPYVFEDKIATQEQHFDPMFAKNMVMNGEITVDQVTDWRVLDKFVASQLSHEDGTKENMIMNDSISTSNCQIDLWK